MMSYTYRSVFRVIGFCCLAINSHAFAEYTSYEAGKALRELLTANHLLTVYKNTVCIKYINPGRLNVLIESNNKAIKNIQMSINSVEYKKLQTLANSSDQVIFLRSLSKTYILDEIDFYKNEAGGISFACGIAYANVMHSQVTARSAIK